ncbi:hypothetical protein [Mycobacteroides chelonae]|uniref:hypothetical protein n=1 Tax=Mycobacteroides chelonae TaxID=1774 RepID=UPI0009947641|nr:hypothetical protein [Mycobacteroides chelonae]
MSVEVDDRGVMTGNEASNLVEVDVEINGMNTTLQLDRAEAERRGLIQPVADDPDEGDGEPEGGGEGEPLAGATVETEGEAEPIATGEGEPLTEATEDAETTDAGETEPEAEPKAHEPANKVHTPRNKGRNGSQR